MKNFIVFCAIFAAAYGYKKLGMRSRFSTSDTAYGQNFLMQTPHTLSIAQRAGYVQVARPEGVPMPSLTLYCPKQDRNFCVLFDDSDWAAGVQVALNRSKFRDNVLDMETQGFVLWEVDGSEYWALTQYFVNEEYLSRSLVERMATRNRSRVLQLDSIWGTSINGELFEIPVQEDALLAANFNTQTCFPGMGYHYMYNQASATCDSDVLVPWYPLVYDGELIGTIFTTYAHYDTDNTERNWFERQPEAVARLVLPNSPTCLFDMSRSPGMVSMHIFYVEDPLVFPCP